MDHPELIPNLDINDSSYDIVVVVTDRVASLTGNLAPLKKPIEDYGKLDSAFEKQPSFISTDAVTSGRVIYSPTGPTNRDYDDVRRFGDAGKIGMERALKAGCKRPLLVIPINDAYDNAAFVATLGALHVLYQPLELQEAGKGGPKVEAMGVHGGHSDMERVAKDLALVGAVEKGRIVTRDIGASDPERMTAIRTVEYLTTAFENTCIKMDVISDVESFQKDYPLLAAVNRAAHVVERHRGRLVYLEYKPDGPIEKTLFLVGKGITYDTGGADIKAGGIMAGMHRDKCGAATVAGFFKVLSEVKPKGIHVHGGLPMVRNSVGEESYVADEIITSRAGVRVRVGNTDAEGRMVMADVLCRMKEKALEAANPQLFTMATLTGHVIKAIGRKYSAIMDNGPARKKASARTLQDVGEVYGDPFEVSTIRREDYETHAGRSEYVDVLQAGNLPSASVPRGHQAPAAFLILASGLDKHGVDSAHPLPYSHIDIAGSCGPYPGIPSTAPLVALAAHFIFLNMRPKMILMEEDEVFHLL